MKKFPLVAEAKATLPTANLSTQQLYFKSNSHTTLKFSFLKLLTPLKDRVMDKTK